MASVLVEIKGKERIATFVQLFDLLKSFGSLINVSWYPEEMKIQCMDASHVCLLECNITRPWFHVYGVPVAKIICVPTETLTTMLHMQQDDQKLVLTMAPDSDDVLFVSWLQDLESILPSCTTTVINDAAAKPKKKAKKASAGASDNSVVAKSMLEKHCDYKKRFKLNLCESDYEPLGIPEVEHTVDMFVSFDTFSQVLRQLSKFGSDVTMQCSDETVIMRTGDIAKGEMEVTMATNELEQYAKVEDSPTLTLQYSLGYLTKLCVGAALSECLELGISTGSPLRCRYQLGLPNCYVSIFLAPKIDENNDDTDE